MLFGFGTILRKYCIPLRGQMPHYHIKGLNSFKRHLDPSIKGLFQISQVNFGYVLDGGLQVLHAHTKHILSYTQHHSK